MGDSYKILEKLYSCYVVICMVISSDKGCLYFEELERMVGKNWLWKWLDYVVVF